ncbi:hypothetical protein UNDKW_1439 [Undibacterium sp. KW1]|nr:hypothetical protein UNDKW_1439 [Undibacterium sp. KW1]
MMETDIAEINPGVRDDPRLDKVLNFLDRIGIAVIERELQHATFLPGLDLGPGCIYVDYSKLKYPGDMVHEAGHLAVTPSANRALIGSDQQDKDWPPQGEEIAAILWSLAVARELDLPLDFVFHPNGYKDDSSWLIETFESGNFIGLPFLEWAGLSLGAVRAEKEGKPAFPHMLKWMRE